MTVLQQLLEAAHHLQPKTKPTIIQGRPGRRLPPWPNPLPAALAHAHAPGPAPTAALAAAAGAATAASHPLAGALNLALPPGRTGLPPPAAWASQDERLHARPTRAERLAQALGTDTRRQESQRGEVRRIQQGRQCLDATPAREAQLNPFNQSVSATPRPIRPC